MAIVAEYTSNGKKRNIQSFAEVGDFWLTRRIELYYTADEN